MSDREVRDQLMTLLLAGHETTATGLAWTLDLLTRHPDVLARARDRRRRRTCARSSPSRCGCARSCRSPAAGSSPTSSPTACALPAGHRRHARDLARPHPPGGLPGPVRLPPRALPRQAALDLHLDPVRRRRPPLPRRARSPRWRCAIVLGAILRRFDLRPASPPRRARRPPQRHLLPPPRHARDRHPRAAETGPRRARSPNLSAPTCGRTRVSEREHFGSCCRSGHGCRRRSVAACLLAPATASAASARVAALQVALRAHGVYAGPVDGLTGPGTTAGVRRIQRRAGLVADGIVGPRTRRALGAPGPPPDRLAPAARRPPRLGRRRAAVRARDARLPVRHGRRRLRRAHRRRRPAPAGVLRPDRRRRRRPGHAAPRSRARRSAPPPCAGRSPPRSATATARAATSSTPAWTSPPPPAPRSPPPPPAARSSPATTTAGASPSSSTTATASTPATPTSPSRRSTSAPRSTPAPRSAASARPASPPARTCTSRSPSAAPTPTRASPSASTEGQTRFWLCAAIRMVRGLTP